MDCTRILVTICLNNALWFSRNAYCYMFSRIIAYCKFSLPRMSRHISVKAVCISKNLLVNVSVGTVHVFAQTTRQSVHAFAQRSSYSAINWWIVKLFTNYRMFLKVRLSIGALRPFKRHFKILMGYHLMLCSWERCSVSQTVSKCCMLLPWY